MDNAKKELDEAAFRDRVAVITGAGSGIGAATAKLLARSGARVAVLDLQGDSLRKLAAELGDQNIACYTKQVDVSIEHEMEAAFKEIGAKFGRMDIVVSNAGINGVWAPLEKITSAEWDRTLGINLRSTFLAIKHSVPWLRQRGGSIIIVSSINGTRVFSTQGATAYACSKAAQIALMKMSALEYAEDWIRVNAICPGSVTTHIDDSLVARDLDMLRRRPVIFPEGEIPFGNGSPAHAEQVAEVAAFLASDHASHITGTEIYLDGGQSLLKG